MKKCPKSFSNPHGPIDCIKDKCPIWVETITYESFIHPDYYRSISEKDRAKIKDINMTEMITDKAHCKEYGDMDDGL